MKVPARKAVSPVVATLLLIVISVISGLTVYAFTSNLTRSLSGVGGQQVTELITLDAYTYAQNPPAASSPLVIALRNSGDGGVTISRVYFDGSNLTMAGNPQLYVATHQVVALALSTTASPVSIGFNGVPSGLGQGTAHQVKVVTTDGASFTFNVLAGGVG